MPLTHQDAHSIETPCFIYDEGELRRNLRLFKSAVEREWNPDRVIMGYSVKTAPVSGLMSLALEEGYYIEVVSDDEFALALESGASPSQVIFNGPIKSKDWLTYAYDNGSIVNIDSKRELEWTIEYAQNVSTDLKVGIRVNFDLEKECPGETTPGTEGGRFGFCWENGELSNVIQQLRDAGVEPSGLHAHFSNKSYSTRLYKAIAEFVCKVIEHEKLDSLSYIDFGGGYFGGGANVGRYDEYAQTIAETIRDHVDQNKVTVILEPGGSVLCTPCEYVGRVIDVKPMRNTQVVVTELSKLNLNSTVFNQKQYTCELIHTDEASDVVERQTICGYTCMEMDRLVDLHNQPSANSGDYVSVKFAGAYSISFSPLFFIQKNPNIYVRSTSGEFVTLKHTDRPTPPNKER